MKLDMKENDRKGRNHPGLSENRHLAVLRHSGESPSVSTYGDFPEAMRACPSSIPVNELDIVGSKLCSFVGWVEARLFAP